MPSFAQAKREPTPDDRNPRKLRQKHKEGGFMDARINFIKLNPGGYKAMLGFGEYLATSNVEKKLLDLICLRVSQINGCAFCLDMHWKDLKGEGESDQRLYSLDAWRETTYYSDRERAALAWAEATTNIHDGHVSDEVFKEARQHFSEQELADLTLAVVAINGWNRLNIAFRTPAGTYQPGQFEKMKKIA
jgi:AhpD family alkylhydroperoxidase